MSTMYFKVQLKLICGFSCLSYHFTEGSQWASLMWSMSIIFRWSPKPVWYMHQCHWAVSPLLRVSHPSQVVLPFPRWEPKEKPFKEDDVGPQVTHIYEVNARPTAKHSQTAKSHVKNKEEVYWWRDKEAEGWVVLFLLLLVKNPVSAWTVKMKDENNRKSRCGKL